MKASVLCWYSVRSKGKKRNYYVNVETGESQWGLPPNEGQKLPPGWEMYASLNKSPGTNYYYHRISGRVQWNDPTIDYKQEIISLPSGWEMKTSKCQNDYYVNKKENKSQWEIPTIISTSDKPRPFRFIIPVDDEIKIVVPSKKAKRVVQPPRALKWTGNSCYVDSALFAFFAGPKNFLEQMLYGKLEENIDMMIPNICTDSQNIKDDLENRKRVQAQLVRIAQSIWRTGEEVEYCSDLRKTFRNCPNSEMYHKTGIGDAGEFITYLLSILSHEPSSRRTETYATNILGLDLDAILEQDRSEEDLFLYTSFDQLGSLVHVIQMNIVQKIGKDSALLSDYLKEVIKLKFPPSELYKADNDKFYKRRIQIRTIEYTPYLIVSVKRVKKSNPNRIIKNIVIPDEVIKIGDSKQLFSLSGVVMHTGGCHYVAIAKYNGVWWYYNDSEYLRGKKLVQYESFEDFMNEVQNDPRTDKINPYTNGTQFYYTPEHKV